MDQYAANTNDPGSKRLLSWALSRGILFGNLFCVASAVWGGAEYKGAQEPFLHITVVSETVCDQLKFAPSVQHGTCYIYSMVSCQYSLNINFIDFVHQCYKRV